MKMTPMIWKLFFIPLVFACFGLLITRIIESPAFLGVHGRSDLGVTTQPEKVLGSKRKQIVKLEANSPLIAHGAKSGDLIDYDLPYDTGVRRQAGERIGLTLITSTAEVHIFSSTVQSSSSQYRFSDVRIVIASLILIASALFLNFKNSQSMACRALASSLMMYAANILTATSPDFVINSYFWSVTVWSCWVSFLIFSIYFPDDQPSGFNQRCIAYLPAYVILIVCLIAFSLWQKDHYSMMLGNLILLTFTGMHSLAIFFNFGKGWISSSGARKQRFLWVLLSFGGYVILMWSTYVLRFYYVDWRELFGDYLTALQMACLLSLMYATLRFRIFNFGFAVNRALVYSATSLILLVSFGLSEWLAEHYLDFEGREKNMLLDAGIALGVYLAFHRVRHSVEHFIEKVFFSSWHHNEEHLRRFIKHASHITTQSDLLEASLSALQRFIGGAACAIYQGNRERGYVRIAARKDDAPDLIGVNDSLAVELRAEEMAVLNDDGHSPHPFALALPMLQRGELKGFILLDNKKNQESYRPDEVEVLDYAAQQIGLDLHGLEIELLESKVNAEATKVQTLQYSIEQLHAVIGAIGKQPGEAGLTRINVV